MSDYENSDYENQELDSLENTLIFLAVNLKTFPEVLQKSQAPEMKQKKDVALKKLAVLYQENFGVPITVKQLMKKINNMKTRLRKKTDKNKTGNEKIVLNEWERILFDLLQGEKNPTIGNIPGALQFGVSKPANKLLDDSGYSVQSICSELVLFENEERPPKKPKFHSKTDKYEPLETRSLSTAELQRVVLLEQLAAARAQKEAALFQIEYLKGSIQTFTYNLE